MRAIRLHEFGGPDRLVLDQLPDLSPGPGQVRVSVEAAGVHLVDTTLRRGDPGPVSLPLPELPTVPGREVAGIVDAVGDDVDAAWLGRRVVAHLGPVPGGYAEQAVAAVDGQLFPVPEGTTAVDAVAAVGTGRTALGVLELEPPSADDVVLVPSAAGGLGWLLVQAARERGATVVAAARGEQRTGKLAELGADLVVDYAEAGWDARVREAVGGVTLVYDGVGGGVGRCALELLRPGGSSRAALWTAWPPAPGGRWSARTPWRRRPAPMPTWRAGGRWARWCCAPAESRSTQAGDCPGGLRRRQRDPAHPLRRAGPAGRRLVPGRRGRPRGPGR